MPLLNSNDSVQRVGRVTLRASDSQWAYAQRHSGEIESHWQEAKAVTPTFFNGIIYLLEHIEMGEGHFSGRLIKTDFKSYLFWRDRGFSPDAGVVDGFGSALIRSAEGHIILGRQRPGNVNSGLAYLPGGFIDGRDVDEHGFVDVAQSVAREVKEETGLGVAELDPQPGFLVTRTGAHVSFAVEYRSHLTSDDLAARISVHIASDPDPELSAVVVIRNAEDCAGVAMPPYAEVLLAHLLPPAREMKC